MDDEIKDINPNNEEKPDGQTEEAPVADDANEEEAQATDGSPTDDTDISDNPTAGEAHSDYKPVNRFDGYIGFQPVNEQTGKLAITGELSLALQNIFHLGERLSLEWRSSEKRSQYLDVDAAFPFLFRTRFGIDGHFRLDKQDTTYLTLNYHLGIPYHFRHDSYLRPYIDFVHGAP